MQMQIVRIAQVLILFAMSCLCIATNTNADTIQESEQVGIVADEVLELAEDIGRWLASNAIQTETGTAWPDNTLSPETISYDLASGVAGKVLYFVALYRATGNAEYLETAQSGADYLVGVLQDPSSFEQNPRRASLYTGISGIGVALLHVQRHASNVKYERAITQIVDQLREWSVEDAGGLRWSDDFNDLIYGDAGTTLFLSYVAEQTADEEALDLATRGARFLLSQAQDAAAGSCWYLRRSKPFNLPNLSH
jgi:lantibiotic modifying enzyme